jgi:hypothetical protein
MSRHSSGGRRWGRARTRCLAGAAGALVVTIGMAAAPSTGAESPAELSATDSTAASAWKDTRRDDDPGRRWHRDTHAAERSAEPSEEEPAPAPAPAPSPSASAPAKAAPAPAPAPAPVARSAGASVVANGDWLSGASGDGVNDGAFGQWRGTDVEIAGTWADNNEAQVEVWPLTGQYEDWNKPLEIAIGAIDDGESWAEAATGAYDSRWSESLTNMRQHWGARTAPLFIRFAHEMNGDWYPWSVNADNYEDFKVAWGRFRALQQQIFPASHLVFGLNEESIGSDVDWRKTFPGADQVDVIGVDVYNGWPDIDSQAAWDESLTEVDDFGAPKGLQAHLDYARSVGLPLSVPEWSGRADHGDSSAFVQGMHSFFAANAGGGPGQVLYEIQFNVEHDDADSFRFFPSTNMPRSAATYRDLF